MTNLLSIKTSEKAALVRFYNLTNGNGWTTKTNWLTNPDISTWYGVTVVNGKVSKLELASNNLVGNLSNWNPIYFSNLTILTLNNNVNLVGDIGKWILPKNLIRIYISFDRFTGDLSNWVMPSTLQYLNLNNNYQLTGNISNWGIPPNAVIYNLPSNQFTGDISGWVLPASLTYLWVNNNLLSGNLSSWNLPPSLGYLRINNNTINGTPNVSSNIWLRDYSCQNNALTQANVDSVIQSIYNRRTAFLYASPILNIGGTNTAPTGTYQVPVVCPALTGKERLHDLVNDSCGTGHKKWTVTYTA